MIRFYFHPTPNPAKVALLLGEVGLDYELIPVDTGKGEQHLPAFMSINPNGKVPAIIDTEGPGGVAVRVFDSSAILHYLGDKYQPAYWHALGPCRVAIVVVLSRHRPWLLFGKAVHFQHAAPEKLPYAINRYRREVERHYRVLDEHMAKRDYIVGNDYSIADTSAWGWLDRASRVLPGEGEPLAAFPITQRFFDAVDARPAVARARLAGHFYTFKRELDEEARRSLFPSNYDSAAC